MLSSLKMKVQAAAKELRGEQKRHYQRLSDFGANEESHDYFGNDDDKMPDYLADTSSQRNQSTASTTAGLIDQDDQTEMIAKVVDSIKTLTNILGQMNDMVIQQGTIVDRIDYNLEQAAKHVKKGNKELKEAKDIADNGFGARIIRYLLIANGVLFLFVLVKYLR